MEIIDTFYQGFLNTDEELIVIQKPCIRGVERMIRNNAREILIINQKVISLRERFKKINNPKEASILLHQTLEYLIPADKQMLQKFIIDLRQNATDLKFKYYRARCQYILIPPEDALTFWINHILGSCPEGSRLAYFEGEILDLLKILEAAQMKENQRGLPSKEVSAAFKIIKNKYPGFLGGLTREPLLIPVMGFSIQSKTVMAWPQYHCFVLFASKNGEERSLISIVHSLVQSIHYSLTGDLNIFPPGFENLQKNLFEEPGGIHALDAESVAETITASLLYDTEYMSQAAYMELNHQQHEAIKNYLIWLQSLFSPGLGKNVKKLMEEHDQKLRA